ncbi:MAG: MarR family transcriptional regulator [Ruminiclostridium sp.]|nr:MarR family transcriptional regulator [Ruminiclostridium sp.]
MERNISKGLRFALLYREFNKKMDARAKSLGLTGVQLRVLGELMVLEDAGREEICQRDLEQAERVTHPTMTTILQRLEEKGFITCQPGRSDRRQKRITSTPQARAMQADVAPNDARTFQEMCRGLTPEQVQAFLEITDVMLGNILGKTGE